MLILRQASLVFRIENWKQGIILLSIISSGLSENLI